jgi:anti-sigma factor RsiW
MQKLSERPVCHRAEDLVTYLYGEATAEDARDLSAHMHQCEACRAEFNVFHQVHDSIVAWRNETLGSLVQVPQVSANAAKAVVATDEFVQHERRLSAVAALREFFSVSPLWLRGATAFAGLLLCFLIVFAISRAWQQPTQLATDHKKYTEQELQRAVEKEVAAQVAKGNEEKREQVVSSRDDVQPLVQVVTRRTHPKTQPANRLTREEREQLAADLGLIPGREEELPFVLPEGEEPNQ